MIEVARAFRAKAILSGVAVVGLFGCNTPSPPAEIPIPKFSTTEFEKLDCTALAFELSRTEADEKTFAAAQERRVASSTGHILYYGWGTGDSFEAVELAKARGKRDAIVRTQKLKDCIKS